MKIVRAHVGRRWINLYRETDPIAGPVLSWKRTRLLDGPPTSQTFDGVVVEGPPRRRTGRRESGDDWRVLDPVPPVLELQVKPLLPLSRHSHFPVTEDYQDAVKELRRRP